MKNVLEMKQKNQIKILVEIISTKLGNTLQKNGNLLINEGKTNQNPQKINPKILNNNNNAIIKQNKD